MSDTVNLARLKKGGETFEVVVDPDKAMAVRHNPDLDVSDALKYPQIYNDAKKGLLAKDDRLTAVFNTTDPLVIAKTIITKGDIQVTAEYRQRQIDQKKQRIINIITQQGVDPRTGSPHPQTRIENALDQAKVRIDEYKPAEQQVADILKALRPILPIKLVVKDIKLTIPAQHAPRAHPIVKQYGKILKEHWQNDGSWNAVVQIPGGLESDFYDKLNGITHGTVNAEVVRTTGETQ